VYANNSIKTLIIFQQTLLIEGYV